MTADEKARMAQLREVMKPARPELTEPPPKPKLSSDRLALLGPINWKGIETVSLLGGAVLAVWLLIHLRTRLSGDRWVSVPGAMLTRMGVNRYAKSRAITALQRTGLIITRYEPGKTALVALVPQEGGRA
jgi:hypothetical protein